MRLSSASTLQITLTLQRGKLTTALASHNYYTAITKTLLISGFRHKLDEICALLGNYAAYSGNSLPTFRDNPLVSSSFSLNMGPIGCPETSARNYHCTLRNYREERRSRKLLCSLYLQKKWNISEDPSLVLILSLFQPTIRCVMFNV